MTTQDAIRCEKDDAARCARRGDFERQLRHLKRVEELKIQLAQETAEELEILERCCPRVPPEDAAKVIEIGDTHRCRGCGKPVRAPQEGYCWCCRNAQEDYL